MTKSKSAKTMKPIKFWMCGYHYTLTFHKNMKDYGSVETYRASIKIKDTAHWFSSLVHELEEGIRIEFYARFYSNNGSQECLFSYNHTQFTVFADELAGALKQIIPQLPKNKQEELMCK